MSKAKIGQPEPKQIWQVELIHRLSRVFVHQKSIRVVKIGIKEVQRNAFPPELYKGSGVEGRIQIFRKHVAALHMGLILVSVMSIIFL